MINLPSRLKRLIGALTAALLVAVPSLVGAAAGTALGAVGRISWKISVLPPAQGPHAASYGEPGIAIARDGTMVVNAAQANTGYPTWWTSHDRGVTWSAGKDLDPSGAMTGDADAAFGPDGSAYVMNLAFNNPPSQPVNPTVYVYASKDGQRYSGPATFPAPHGADQPDRPWLVPDPYRPARVFVSNSEGAGDVVWWTSIDHAATFTGPTLVTGLDHAASIELTSRPFFDTADQNRIFMLYEASSPAGIVPPDLAPLRDFPLTQLWIAESDDAGQSWSNRLVLDITQAFGSAGGGGSLGHVTPACAIDRAGNIYAAYSLRLGGESETHIYLIHSIDHGVDWSEPTRVDAGTRSNVLPALATGDPGHVVLAWYSSDAAAFTDTNARWFEMVATSANALALHPTFTPARLGGVTHVGSVDASGNPGSSINNWALRDFQSVAIDGAGMAHIAWTDSGHSRTIVARQVAGPSFRANPKPAVLGKKVTEARRQDGRHLAATGVGDGTIEGSLLLTVAGAVAAWRRRSYR